jgi:hypothetical protein
MAFIASSFIVSERAIAPRYFPFSSKAITTVFPSFSKFSILEGIFTSFKDAKR